MWTDCRFPNTKHNTYSIHSIGVLAAFEARGKSGAYRSNNSNYENRRRESALNCNDYICPLWWSNGLFHKRKSKSAFLSPKRTLSHILMWSVWWFCKRIETPDLIWQGRIQNYFLRRFDLIILPYLPYVFGKTCLSKQCRPWSDAAECGVWSGSTLFATHPEILNTFISCKMDFLKRSKGKK